MRAHPRSPARIYFSPMIAYLDMPSGISGDMTLGALIACGVPEGELRDQLSHLNLSGWELVANLRANPEWSTIPVVIITADYHAERKREETGAIAVITKPFDIDQLVLEHLMDV